MTQADPGREAAEMLAAAGIPVNAWMVLAHNSRLGLAFAELTVLNCFGERYPYALCPAQPEVRDHCAVLAAEALHDLPAVASVSLESVGQMGAAHLGCHEKTDGAYSPAGVAALLSVCCCQACQTRWRAHGLDPGAASSPDLREAMTLPATRWPPQLLRVRQEATDELRREVLAAVRQAAPGAPVTLHAHPDPWATGPSPGLTPTAVSEVDAVLVPCWPTAEQTADLVRATAALGAVVDAYVSVLPPADADALPAHVRAAARGRGDPAQPLPSRPRPGRAATRAAAAGEGVRVMTSVAQRSPTVQVGRPLAMARFSPTRNELNESQFAGPAFSHDGKTLFVNIQSPGYVLAITGPWRNC